jgi:Ca2+-binding EF-hand superfamily protein
VEYKPLEEKDLYGLKISKRALKNLSPAEIRDLVEVFQAFSRTKMGYLKAKELFYAFRALGFNLSEEMCARFIESETSDSEFKFEFFKFLIKTRLCKLNLNPIFVELSI